MPEPMMGFDPLGWFTSTCITVLVGAVALTVAVHLLAAIWVWLVIGALVVTALGVLVMLLLAWHRRRQW